ncbi:MAG: LytR/AlgR family response regulator transcription factor [Bacteroidales bacterium]
MVNAMQQLSCLIVDDEPMALALLQSYVEKTPFLDLKAVCESAFEVMEYLNANAPVDVVFSDIQMPDLSGLEFAKHLPKSTKLVFTTAFDRYAIDGYKVNAVDYLLKPFNYSEFLAAANKVLEMNKSIDAQAQYLTDNKEFIFVKSEYRQLKIYLKDILYIEGMKDYAKFYLASSPKPILSLISMKKLESELPSALFMRLHRSFIVALDKIDSLERSQVIIGKQRITVAPQYKEAFDEYLQGKMLR